MSTVKLLVKKLTDACVAYYETGNPIMSDETYDHLLDELREMDPNHEFFSRVGATPSRNVVTLPIAMPSLNKIKPASWESMKLQGPYVCSAKLDGVSALWCVREKKLYLRGNGIQGQDVSHLVGKIQGLVNVSSDVYIRGELIVPRKLISNARNWVNGIIHQKKPRGEDMAQIQFVAYNLYGGEKERRRSDQFTQLQAWGFLVPWFQTFSTLTVDQCNGLFTNCRNENVYECDGVVIGRDVVPVALDKKASNPTDMIAYKVPSDDQRAETTVITVHWNSSKGGLWIPQIEFTPVVIGGATIRFCTGHHANNIEGKKIGPGAVVVIRRSGDVIPYLENVLVPCKTGGQMPPTGTWVYDENRVHAMDIRDGEDNEKKSQTLCHTFQVFGLEGISDKTCLKLVEGGVLTLLDVLNASEKTLEGLIGPALAKKCKTSLQSLLEKASPEQWIRAWTRWPRGFGPTRIQAFLQAKPKVEEWNQIKMLPGSSADSIGDVVMCVPDYLVWRKPYEGFMNKEVTVVTPVISGPVSGYVVFSGFRSKELEALFTAKGWVIQDSINKQTTALVVQDATKETSKTKAARAKNIRIVAVDDVQRLFEK